MTDPLQTLTYYQIDAFTDRLFAGNPAAVVLLEAWLDDTLLGAIAAEHNLSETAFVVPGEADTHELRWFTPACEVELCGHGTLASAFVLLYCMEGHAAPLRFTTRYSGTLIVTETDDRLWLDLPALPPARFDDGVEALNAALGATATEWLAASNNLAVFESADQVAALAPDMRALTRQSDNDGRGVIVTAPADDGHSDFVSRFFAPAFGNDEDPVTGSAHCTLAPFWGKRLGKTELLGHQISRRGGHVACRLDDDRVHLGGCAMRYAQGTLVLPLN